MMRIAPAAIVALALASTGGGNAQPIECHLGKPQQVAELVFGRNISSRLGVSDAQWARFVDREITPRFPDGLTVFDTRGQWRDAKRGRIMREPGKLVQIVLPGNAEDADRLNDVIRAYKGRFRQQSVGLIVRTACVSF
jgi:Protein of unknown function (DUF3574)